MQALTVNYTIRIDNPNSHYAKVIMELSGVRDKSIDIKMPVWTPGSYMVREFERNIQDASAFSNGEKLGLSKTDKSTWRIQNSKGLATISFSYTVYCFEPTVRTSYIDSDHAFLLLTSCLMYTGNTQSNPGTVKMEYPAAWSRISTTLEKKADNTYAFTNYDELADSPIEIGNHREISFEVAGVPHKAALVGLNNCPEEKFTADLKKTCETMYHIVGTHPCKSYLFIIHHVEEGGGGLEHANSCVVQMPRFNYSNPDKYEAFMGLCAHEYFHLWNVKRIRPAALGPFDYSKENYTNLLWVAEGITSYYDELALYRAGFISQDKYMKGLASTLNMTLNRIGGSVQSLHDASFDSWIKEYRPNENSINSNISYYLKGAAVAALLDIELLSATGGRKSLDDLMRYLYAEYYIRQNRGFSDKEFYDAVNLVAGKNLDIREWVEQPNNEGTKEKIRAVLKKAGCNFEDKTQANPLFTGINTEIKGEKLLVRSIEQGSPAFVSGFQLGDELIAVGNIRIKTGIEETFKNAVAEKGIYTVTISRAGIVRVLEIQPGGAAKSNLNILVEDKENVVFKAWMMQR
jgi:predicted metalloprotease with PDZ domain